MRKQAERPVPAQDSPKGARSSSSRSGAPTEIGKWETILNERPQVVAQRALADRLDQSPRVAAQRRRMENLSMRTGTAQLMRWTKQGDNPVPERAPHGHWQDGDVWDDESGNVYDGQTGLLKYNYSAGDFAADLRDQKPEYTNLPEDIRKEFFTVSGIGTPIDVSSAKKEDSHRVRLNKLISMVNKWLSGLDPLTDSSKKQAGESLLARIKALKENTLYAEAPYLPKTQGARGSMAMAGAAKELYTGVEPARASFFGEGTVPMIDSSTGSDEAVGRYGLNLGTLRPSGEGLKWWASAAMGLRETATYPWGSDQLILQVGGGRVPIVLRPPDEQHPRGEYIVLGQGAPVAFDLNPDMRGLRTPSSADPKHRVSYPAFVERLKTVRRPGLDDKLSDGEIAAAMLKMVRDPYEDPEGIELQDLGVLQELLVTLMVAEPSRHRSAILSSVLMLQDVAGGRYSFEDALQDGGKFPMSGKGTAEGGREAEVWEADVLAGKDIGDPVRASSVVRRQTEALETSPDNLSTPLEAILRDYAGFGGKLRHVPALPTQPPSAKKASSGPSGKRRATVAGPASSSSSPLIQTFDPSGLLADTSTVWNEDAIGRIFQGRDGRNLQLQDRDRRTGTFFFMPL